MTIQAPLHLQRRCLIRNRHLIDLSMTRRTTHTLVYMNAVIEIGEVRQVVHSNPFDRLASAKALANRLQIRAVRPNLFVTAHAGGGCRQPGGRSRFDRSVAVATVNAIVADVMLVTKLDWLLALNPLSRVPRGAVQLSRDPQQRNENKNGAIDRQLCQRVSAVMKNLRHRENLSVLRYCLQISVQPDNCKT